jgi:hypothetical protein
MPGAGQFIAPIVILLLVLAIRIVKRPRGHRAVPKLEAVSKNHGASRAASCCC